MNFKKNNPKKSKMIFKNTRRISNKRKKKHNPYTRKKRNQRSINLANKY